jgi:1-acyl-sn-glycerol-3-phosphate acyltransferase
MPSSVIFDPPFYPPQLNPLFTRICQSFSYPIAYCVYQLELAIAPADIERLKAIEDERIIYLPNHPTLDDGVVLFLLSTRLGQLFHYIVAYEAFKGLPGKFLQRIGAYSIRRGLGDRASIVQTLKLLQEPACRLVIFPEGGCSYQNDTVMPFRSGAVELALKALNRLAQHHTTIPNFYLVPVSLKYRYTSSMNSVIEQTLSRLEKALSIEPVVPDCYQRLRMIAEQVLLNLEQEYDIDNNLTTEKNWNQRIEQLKNLVLEKCEQKLNLTSATNLPMRERVYKIQSILESRSEKLSQEQATYNALYQTTVRLLNFNAIYDGYVASDPTPERFMDTLIRFEREVFQIEHPRPKGHRKAHLSIGEIINIKHYFDQYKQNRETTVENLTQQLQQNVQSNLDLLNASYSYKLNQ